MKFEKIIGTTYLHLASVLTSLPSSLLDEASLKSQIGSSRAGGSNLYGSATNAAANGGAGVHIKSPEGQTSTAGIHSTNFSAEVQALVQAASMVQNMESNCSQVVFF